MDAITLKKTADFSLHQFPTTNMRKELKDHTDIDIRILVVQPEYIPDEIAPGLSNPVKAAIPDMCSRIISILDKEKLQNYLLKRYLQVQSQIHSSIIPYTRHKNPIF